MGARLAPAKIVEPVGIPQWVLLALVDPTDRRRQVSVQPAAVRHADAFACIATREGIERLVTP
jgi:hypothetical protein